MKRIFNSSQLKIIALISMLIDHCAICLADILPSVEYIIMRSIGRLAFPIFVFLLVQGLKNTGSVGKYMARVGIFAVLSEIPYDILKHKSLWYPTDNNIMFTLLLALLALWITKCLKDKGPYGIMTALLSAVLLGAAAYYLELDYAWKCVALAMLFYIAENETIVFCVGTVCIFAIEGETIAFAAILALPLLCSYNGEKGRMPKNILYFFYPVHLLLLGLVRCYFIG